MTRMIGIVFSVVDRVSISFAIKLFHIDKLIVVKLNIIKKKVLVAVCGN